MGGVEIGRAFLPECVLAAARASFTITSVSLILRQRCFAASNKDPIVEFLNSRSITSLIVIYNAHKLVGKQLLLQELRAGIECE